MPTMALVTLMRESPKPRSTIPLALKKAATPSAPPIVGRSERLSARDDRRAAEEGVLRTLCSRSDQIGASKLRMNAPHALGFANF